MKETNGRVALGGGGRSRATMGVTMNRIVDAHHHIWRQRDLPWLMGPMQPRIFGPYEPIRRDYAIEEYLGDIEGSGCRAVDLRAGQLGRPRERSTRWAWVQAEAERTGYPHAIVGYADLRDPDVGAVLEAQSRYPAAARASACSSTGTRTSNIASPTGRR